MSSIEFIPLDPADLFEIKRQESQLTVLGQDSAVDSETAEILASQPVAWTAWVAGRPLACFGISELFESVHGLAWALLSNEIGVHHLQLTRFMQRQIRECGLQRLELLAKASDVEFFAEKYHWMDPGVLVSVAMADPTPECRWAVLLGMKPAHVLRRFGAASESYMLFERFC